MHFPHAKNRTPSQIPNIKDHLMKGTGVEVFLVCVGNVQGCRFSANWLNSAILGLILIISEISANLLGKNGMGRGGA